MRKAILAIIVSTLIISPLSSSAFTRYKFNAKPLDTESNLYYYGQRYYDPNIGRFTQPDPVANYLTNQEQMKKATGMDLQKFLENPQNLNSYSYTINNPVKYTDPTGEWWKEFFTGQQSISSLYGEIGEASMYVNPVMSATIDHPYLSGAAIGLGTGLGLIFAGVAAGTAPWQIAAAGSTVVPATGVVAQKLNNLPQLNSLKQVSTAVDKLSNISRVIGRSVSDILEEANKTQVIFKDMKHDGNINIFIQHPNNVKEMIRVTLDPTKNRIISAGYDRITDIINYVESGRFIKTE